MLSEKNMTPPTYYKKNGTGKNYISQISIMDENERCLLGILKYFEMLLDQAGVKYRK